MTFTNLKPLILATSLIAISSPAISACVDDLDSVNARIVGFEQRGLAKEADHPLVVKLKNGQYSDLRGEEPRSLPIENWMVDNGKKQQLVAKLQKAQESASANDEEKCHGIVAEANKTMDSYELEFSSK